MDVTYAWTLVLDEVDSVLVSVGDQTLRLSTNLERVQERTNKRLAPVRGQVAGEPTLGLCLGATVLGENDLRGDWHRL